MKEIRNLIESSEEYRIQGNAGAAHLKLLDAIRALVASVEALEKSEANAHFGFALHGSEIATLRDRVEALEKRCLSSSGHLDKRIDECTAASGGPKREALPNPLDQWGDPPFPAEAAPKPTPDLWSSCAPKPCTFCGEVTTTGYNATPLHRGCSRPAPPDAGTQERTTFPKITAIQAARLDKGMCPDCGGFLLNGPRGGENQNVKCRECGASFNVGPVSGGTFGKERIGWPETIRQQPPPPAAPERQERKACPCHHVTPCSQECTCVKPLSSRGCERCCSYGNPEQQKVRAVHLTEQQPAQWREAAKLVQEWREYALQLSSSSGHYKSDRCQEKADRLKICADQLAALLPPEKEPKP